METDKEYLIILSSSRKEDSSAPNIYTYICTYIYTGTYPVYYTKLHPVVKIKLGISQVQFAFRIIARIILETI